MTCRLKNYTSGCQAFVLGELLKFTTEFKARSSLHARTHSVTCVLKRSGCRLLASSFLVKRSRRRTTEKVEDKNCQRRGAVARVAGLSAQRQGAKEASSFRYFSTSFEVIWLVCYRRFSRLRLKTSGDIDADAPVWHKAGNVQRSRRQVKSLLKDSELSRRKA